MYLHRRKNGFYYFRRPVPADLIGVIDQKESHYSLATNVRRKGVGPLRRCVYAV